MIILHLCLHQLLWMLPQPMDVPFILDIDPIQVVANGVAELLRSLEAHKATGCDKIPAQLLKETGNLLAPSLTLIF